MSRAAWRGAALLGAAVAAIVAPARAQSGAHASLSQRRVEVGQTFTFKVSLPTGMTIEDAKLVVPPGVQSAGPRIGMEVTMANGQVSQSITATWQLNAARPGKYRIGPATITLSAARLNADAQVVEVVPASNPGASVGVDPFDPLGIMRQFGGGGMFPPGLLQNPDGPAAQDVDSTPDDMRTDQARDPLAFLRATLSPHRVVVGEQVLLRIYAYGSRGRYGRASVTEPMHGDFLSYNVDSADAGRFYATSIGGSRFLAQKLRSLALFPLHAGTLQAGGMKFGFAGPGYPAQDPSKGLLRESNLPDVIVSEPPLQGRPPGYKVGDVGDYTLSAELDPKQVVAGEAVSVVATLSGTGNVPFKLLTPEKPGVEWLDPSVSEHVDAKDEVVQGSRTFTYVVRLNDPGAIDLGELTLPFYDPKQHAYRVARAALGVVTVKPNPKAPSASGAQGDQPADRLAAVLGLRKALGADASAQKPLSDTRTFWIFLLGAPLGVIVSGGGLSLLGSLRERLRARGQSLSAQVEQALTEAERAASNDAARTVAAVERALFGTIELRLGLKARAVLKSELAATLAARGLPEPLARETGELLEDCDALRFIGEPSGVRPVELVARARSVVTELRAAKVAQPS